MNSEQPGLVIAQGRERLSVVLPVYKTAAMFPELHARLVAALELRDLDFDLVYVDDRSPDGAWQRITDVAEDDPRVHGVRLSRNFGQHGAIAAGLASAEGDWVVIMDADLQDPPEAIGDLLDARDEDLDVVIARRTGRYQPRWRMLAGRAFFAGFGVLSGVKLDPSEGSFSLISRRVVLVMREVFGRRALYLLTLRSLGFGTATVDVARDRRGEGRSSYGPIALARHALTGALTQVRLLTFVAFAGLGSVALGVLVALVLSIRDALGGGGVSGAVAVIVAMVIVGGLIVLAIGIVGLYVGRLQETVVGLPAFVVDRYARSDVPGERATDS